MVLLRSPQRIALGSFGVPITTRLIAAHAATILPPGMAVIPRTAVGPGSSS
jgi:hypothetical protein